MGIFDEAKKKATEFLDFDSGEQKSDGLLDKAADKAKGLLGEDKADQINKVRDAVDERIGKNNGGEENPAN